jgi:hypothetical protein
MTLKTTEPRLSTSEAIALVFAHDYDRFPTYPVMQPRPGSVVYMSLRAARAPSLTPVPERSEVDLNKPLPSPPFDLELFPRPPERVFMRRPRLRPRPDSELLPVPCDWLPLPEGIARVPGFNFF